MQNLYQMMRERILSIEFIKKTKSNLTQQGRALQKQIAKQKKNEKLRILKENNSLEALFTFRQSSKKQRQAFEAISYEVMKSINPFFQYQVKD